MFYTQSEWLLFFFFYCFCGWIWESCFVSFQKKRWVNRGFLHGPFLPIYGFGAVIILWLTLPVQENLILIYLIGMAGATVLEYFTGALMERLFHMRYWDYSNMRFNLNGHICLACSLGWGVFSVLLVKVIHPPIEKMILKIPSFIADPLSLVCICAFAVDTALSVRMALDVKELLTKLSESSRTLSRIETRIENAKLRISQRHLMMHEKAASIAEEIRQQLKQSSHPAEQNHLQTILEDLQTLQKQLGNLELDLSSRRNRDYKKVSSILRRNPSAVSAHHKEVFAELKQLLKEEHDSKKKE